MRRPPPLFAARLLFAAPAPRPAGAADPPPSLDTLAGRDDWITPPEQAERMHAAIPNAELVIFEESGHFPFIEEQAAFLSTVEDWLGRLN